MSWSMFQTCTLDQPRTHSVYFGTHSCCTCWFCITLAACKQNSGWHHSVYFWFTLFSPSGFSFTDKFGRLKGQLSLMALIRDNICSRPARTRNMSVRHLWTNWKLTEEHRSSMVPGSLCALHILGALTMLMKAGLLIKLAMSNPNPAAIWGTQTSIKRVRTPSFDGMYRTIIKASSLFHLPGWLLLYASARQSSGWICKCRSQGPTLRPSWSKKLPLDTCSWQSGPNWNHGTARNVDRVSDQITRIWRESSPTQQTACVSPDSPHPPVCFAVRRINPDGSLTVTGCLCVISQLTVCCSPTRCE